VQKSVLEDYDSYEFHPAAAKLQNFCSEELSAFYLMFSRIGSTPAGRIRLRVVGAKCLYHITQSLLRLIAP
jgi:isoleucyl-tRNA synthetase